MNWKPLDFTPTEEKYYYTYSPIYGFDMCATRFGLSDEKFLGFDGRFHFYKSTEITHVIALDEIDLSNLHHEKS